MAVLTLTFDTGTVTLTSINDDIAAVYGYKATLEDGTPNPETKAQFSRQVVKNFIINIVNMKKQQDAQVAAQTSVTPITLT